MCRSTVIGLYSGNLSRNLQRDCPNRPTAPRGTKPRGVSRKPCKNAGDTHVETANPGVGVANGAQIIENKRGIGSRGTNPLQVVKNPNKNTGASKMKRKNKFFCLLKSL